MRAKKNKRNPFAVHPPAKPPNDRFHLRRLDPPLQPSLTPFGRPLEHLLTDPRESQSTLTVPFETWFSTRTWRKEKKRGRKNDFSDPTGPGTELGKGLALYERSGVKRLATPLVLPGSPSRK